MALRFCRPLTVKLRGRTSTPDQRGGRTLSSCARGAQPPAHHGPFQRWLEDALIQPTVRARFPQRKPCPRPQRNFTLNRSRICDKRSWSRGNHPGPCIRTARAPAVSNEGSLLWLFALVAFVA